MGITSAMLDEVSVTINKITNSHKLSKQSLVYEDQDSVSWVLSNIKKCKYLLDEMKQTKDVQSWITNALLSQYLQVNPILSYQIGRSQSMTMYYHSMALSPMTRLSPSVEDMIRSASI